MHDTRTPLIIAVLTILVNIGMSWWLSGRMGHAGLALSLSITYVLRMLGLLAVLYTRTGWVRPGESQSLFKIVVAAMPFLGISLLFGDPVSELISSDDVGLISGYIGFLAAVSIAFASYFVAAYLLRIPEFDQLLSRVRRRL